jgi:hypothetical protein
MYEFEVDTTAFPAAGFKGFFNLTCYCQENQSPLNFLCFIVFSCRNLFADILFVTVEPLLQGVAKCHAMAFGFVPAGGKTRRFARTCKQPTAKSRSPSNDFTGHDLGKTLPPSKRTIPFRSGVANDEIKAYLR